MNSLPYGVIFDMDGVLVDSESFICKAASKMFAEHGAFDVDVFTTERTELTEKTKIFLPLI